jgi:hypothetical protein
VAGPAGSDMGFVVRGSSRPFNNDPHKRLVPEVVQKSRKFGSRAALVTNDQNRSGMVSAKDLDWHGLLRSNGRRGA